MEPGRLPVDEAMAVVLGADDEVAIVIMFVADIFADIGSAIADVDPQFSLGRRSDGLTPRDPESGLAGRAIAASGAALAFGNVLAASEDLAGQSEHGAVLGADG